MSLIRTMNPKTLEKQIHVSFKNQNVLKEALTHRSYLNENPSWPIPHNERLEFLGDAVLELIVTEVLYAKYPNFQEGQLTSIRAALVNYQMLGSIAREIGIEEFILLSRGESKDTGKAREVILANTMEALIGAIYMDAGYDAAKKFVEQFILSHTEEIVKGERYKDPKSLLQEKAQEKLRVTPSYRVLQETGPDHQKQFLVGVYFGDTLIAESEGTSKQEGESRAAEEALKKFK